MLTLNHFNFPFFIPTDKTLSCPHLLRFLSKYAANTVSDQRDNAKGNAINERTRIVENEDAREKKKPDDDGVKPLESIFSSCKDRRHKANQRNHEEKSRRLGSRLLHKDRQDIKCNQYHNQVSPNSLIQSHDCLLSDLSSSPTFEFLYPFL